MLTRIGICVVASGILLFCGCKTTGRGSPEVFVDNGIYPTLTGRPGAGVEFAPWESQNSKTDPSWGPVLTDMVQHLPSTQDGVAYDRNKTSWARELSRAIAMHHRSNLNQSGKPSEVFYLLEGRTVVVPEPNVRKAWVAQFVPMNLRGTRFSMYVTGGENTGLLDLWDEWVAFTNGAAVATDLAAAGLWHDGRSDVAEACLEFTVYALASAMAVQSYDPDYFKNTPQFAEVLAYQIERSMQVYNKAARMPAFRGDSGLAYFKTFSSNAAAEPLREFARRLFGEEWVGTALLPSLDASLDRVDTDGDGVVDVEDRCSRTAEGMSVWKDGEFRGCGEGEKRDYD